MVNKDKRALFSRGDKAVLSVFFEQNRYPSQEEKVNLAVQIHKPVAKLNNWFKNERARKSRTTPVHVKLEEIGNTKNI